jgi:hypothetical protein
MRVLLYSGRCLADHSFAFRQVVGNADCDTRGALYNDDTNCR